MVAFIPPPIYIATVVACVLSVAVSLGAQARLYKCTDPKGKVTYQESPCSGDKDEGSLTVQDQGTGQVYGGAASRSGASEKAMGRYRQIVGEGNCFDKRIPWHVLTEAQTQSLYATCEDSAPRKKLREEYLAKSRADSVAREQVGAPRVGMTAADVRGGTWGEPEKINKTTTGRGVREQWVYRRMGRYVYLENDIVVAIQE